MHFIGDYLGLTRQLETLLWTIVGICYTTFDTSLFRLKDDLFQVWSLNLDAVLFSDKTQIFMKYLISGIILIRTLSVHVYLAMYIVMLWPIIFEDRPGLILPWLTVGAIRNIVTVFLSFVAGNYICLKYFFTKLICYEYLLSQIIEHGPSVYMWICVLSYYKELRKQKRTTNERIELEEIVRRRRRTRSLMRKLCSYDPNIDRQLVSISTIENVVNQLTATLHRPNTRSLDSLLTNLAAEADQEELLNMEQMKNIEEENDLNIQEKTKKLLNLSESEVEAARFSKCNKSSLSLTNIMKYSKLRDTSLKTYMNVFNQKSEYSVNTRVQSDPTIFRCTKSGKFQGKCSVGPSETEIRTISMSDDGSNSIFFTCACNMEDDGSSNENLILSHKESSACCKNDNKKFGEYLANLDRNHEKLFEGNSSKREEHNLVVETIKTFVNDESTTTFDVNYDKASNTQDSLNLKTSNEEITRKNSNFCGLLDDDCEKNSIQFDAINDSLVTPKYCLYSNISPDESDATLQEGEDVTKTAKCNRSMKFDGCKINLAEDKPNQRINSARAKLLQPPTIFVYTMTKSSKNIEDNLNGPSQDTLMNALDDEISEQVEESNNPVQDPKQICSEASYTSLNFTYDSTSDTDVGRAISAEDSTINKTQPIEHDDENNNTPNKRLKESNESANFNQTSLDVQSTVKAKQCNKEDVKLNDEASSAKKLEDTSITNNFVQSTSKDFRKTVSSQNKDAVDEDLNLFNRLGEALKSLFKENVNNEEIKPISTLEKKVNELLDEVEEKNIAELKKKSKMVLGLSEAGLSSKTCKTIVKESRESPGCAGKVGNANKSGIGKITNRDALISNKRAIGGSVDMGKSKNKNSIRYPKGEKCHHDGFMLDYLNKMKNKQSTGTNNKGQKRL